MWKAKDSGDTESAAEAIRQIRGDRLWRELGFTSFNDFAKSKDCPYSSNYAYKMSAAPTDLPPLPHDRPATDSELEAARDGLLELVQDPAMREVLSPRDLRGNELNRDMAKLFSHAKMCFDILDEAIHKMRDTLRELTSDRSGARFSVHSRSAVLMHHLHDIEGIVNNCRPYSVCISCSGNRRECRACGGVGFVTEQQYIDATTRRRRG